MRRTHHTNGIPVESFKYIILDNQPQSIEYAIYDQVLPQLEQHAKIVECKTTSSTNGRAKEEAVSVDVVLDIYFLIADIQFSESDKIYRRKNCSIK